MLMERDGRSRAAARAVFAALAVLSATVAALVVLFGGFSVLVGGFTIRVPHPDDPLTLALLFALCAVLLTGRTGLLDTYRSASDFCRRNEKRILPVVVVGAFLYLLRIKLLQHFSFHTSAFDLSLFDTAVRNTLRGRFMFSDQLGRCFFSEHFSPILLLFVPLYAVFDSPVTLLAVECVCVAGSLWFAWRLARIMELEPLTALCSTVVLLNYGYLARGVMIDFHPELMEPLFLLGAIWCVVTTRRTLYWLFLLLSLFCKEDVAIYTFALGICVFARGQKGRGVATVLVSAAWAVTAWTVIIPAYAASGEGVSHFVGERWSHLGSSYSEVFVSVIASPGTVATRLFMGAGAGTVLGLAGIPVLAPEILVIAVPGMVLNLLSRFEEQALLRIHYAAPIVPFMAWAFLVGLRRLGTLMERVPVLRRRSPKAWLAGLVLVMAVTTFGSHYAFYRLDAHASAVRSVLREVPEGSTVSAQSALVPHLVRRSEPFLFPHETARDVSYKDTDYVLLDTRANPWPLEQTAFDRLASRLLSPDSPHRIVHETAGVYLLQNTRRLPCGPSRG